MKETSQSQPAPNLGQNVDLFLLIKNASVVNLQDTPEDRVIFRLGNTFGFNLLTKFNGLDYVFLGNFGALHGHPIIWRLSKLLELLDARFKAIPTRVQAGFTTEKAIEQVDFFMQRLEIWLIVPGSTEENEIRSWLGGRSQPFQLEVFTLGTVNEIVSQLPGVGSS